MEKEKKHHFLYYIFRFDKKTCIMDEKKTASIKRYLLRVLRKGE